MIPTQQVLESGPAAEAWSYDDACSPNRGLITAPEQQKVRTGCVEVIGMGGVGGFDLVTLAQLGIGRFASADPNAF
jgi:tRNA A37 threonylcarbamoyladenosine dehydratase